MVIEKVKEGGDEGDIFGQVFLHSLHKMVRTKKLKLLYIQIFQFHKKGRCSQQTFDKQVKFVKHISTCNVIVKALFCFIL